MNYLINFDNNKITNFKYITSIFGGLLSAVSQYGGNYLFLLPEAYLFLVAIIFKSSEKFKADFITDILSIDCLSGEFRFYVVYILRSAAAKAHFVLHVGVKEGAALASVANIFCGAIWPEREV
jgi:NADH:ubiquinone oxidoreductase subunit C